MNIQPFPIYSMFWASVGSPTSSRAKRNGMMVLYKSLRQVNMMNEVPWKVAKKLLFLFS